MFCVLSESLDAAASKMFIVPVSHRTGAYDNKHEIVLVPSEDFPRQMLVRLPYLQAAKLQSNVLVHLVCGVLHVVTAYLGESVYRLLSPRTA